MCSSDLPDNCKIVQFEGSTGPWTSGPEITSLPDRRQCFKIQMDLKRCSNYGFGKIPSRVFWCIFGFSYEFHFRIFIWFYFKIWISSNFNFIHNDIFPHYRETHWTKAHLWSIYQISYEPPDGSQIARTLYKISLCRED